MKDIQNGYVKNVGYESLEFTNYLRLLELALGTEKVMELGKGDIYGRIPEILNMIKDDVVMLLSNCDILYKINSEVRKLELLKTIIENKVFDIDDNRYEENLEVFAEIRTCLEYQMFLNEKDDTDENFLEYLKTEKGKFNDRRKSLIN